jgi:hypothetical protein
MVNNVNPPRAARMNKIILVRRRGEAPLINAKIITSNKASAAIGPWVKTTDLGVGWFFKTALKTIKPKIAAIMNNIIAKINI